MGGVGLGNDIDSGLEADFEGAGVPRYGFKFSPLGIGEPLEVLKQGSNNIRC